MIWEFIKDFWRPLAAIIAAGLVIWWFRHYGDVRYAAGYQQAVSEQTAAAAKLAIKNAQQERDDEKRIADAYKARDESEAVLAGIRAQPAPAPLVCHRAPSRSSVLPEAAGLSADHPPARGLLPETHAGDSGEFDPSPSLIALSDNEMAVDIANCRLFVQSVLGHVPTR